MIKELRLFKYVDGVNDTPFPSSEEQIVISSYEYNANRMGGAPKISAKVKYRSCLDETWGNGVYATFREERYFVVNVPSSQKDNTDERYSYDLELMSERDVLDHIYFLDVVKKNDSCFASGVWKEDLYFWYKDRWVSKNARLLGVGNDTAVSNSPMIQFFGDIKEFTDRINASLSYSSAGYRMVIDEGIVSEEKFISFENKYISEALQEINNTFKLSYYFVGRTIHVGNFQERIPTTFKYGQDNALLSISKNNAKHKLINRATGIGSEDNIPYYYPNLSPKGKIAAEAGTGNKGIESSDIEIVNYEKFSDKVKTTEKIEYKYSETKVTSYIKGRNANRFDSKYEGGDVKFNMDAPSDKERLSFKFPANISAARNGRFTINLFEHKNEISLDQFFKKTYVRYADGREIEGYLDKGNQIVFFGLTSGSFDVYVDVELTYQGTMVYSISLEATGVSENYWEYEGKDVALSVLGLKLKKTAKPITGDTISQTVLEYITPSKNLMPPVYRESKGDYRFYNAKNGVYPKPDGTGNYEFSNEYSPTNPQEGFQKFEEIRPTIEGIKNLGARIDVFEEFAYDENDNDEFDKESGEYKHPYFFGKLRPLGFNLFDMAADKREMVVSMKSGSCGACEFVIGVGKKSDKNTVQIDESGNLLRYGKDSPYAGEVICGREGRPGVEPMNVQNDTTERGVWIALRKDNQTYDFTELTPSNVLKPESVKSAGSEEKADKFVILGMLMPQKLVEEAEKRLEEAIVKFMFENNDDKFSFNVRLSRIFLAQNPSIEKSLNENSLVNIEYNGRIYPMYVESYRYRVDNEILPNVEISLKDTVSVYKSSIESRISQVRDQILSTLGDSDIVKTLLPLFLSKNVDDSTTGIIRFLSGLIVGNHGETSIDKDGKITTNSITTGNFISGFLGSGFGISYDESTGRSRMEIDELFVRVKAVFSQLQIMSIKYAGGNWIFSPSGMECTFVEPAPKEGAVDNGQVYRCYFSDQKKGTSKKLKNYFALNDLVRCDEADMKEGTTDNAQNRHYWMKCVTVGDDYIDLSAKDGDKDASSNSIPMAGDTMVTIGNTSDKGRQNAIVISAYGDNSPSIIQYKGINNFNLLGKEVTVISPKGNKFTGDFTLTTGQDVGKAINDSDSNIKSLTERLTAVEKQNDGAIEFWFGKETPTLTNKPAVDWKSNELKDKHLADMYYSDSDKTYRFSKKEDGSYYWKEVVDSEAKAAMDAARKAQTTAEGKMTVFIKDESHPNPIPPYNVGDLWLRDGELYSCNFAKAEGEAFAEENWGKATKYTDDTAANEAKKDVKNLSTLTASLQKKAEATEKELSDIANDNILTPYEKVSVKEDIDDIMLEYGNVTMIAKKYGIDYTSYNKTYRDLTEYVSPLISETSMGNNSEIVGTEFRKYFHDYYSSRNSVLRIASTKAKDLADAAQKDATAAKELADNTEKRIDIWASDGYISPEEKISLSSERDRVKNETIDYIAQATGLSKDIDTSTFQKASDEYIKVLSKYVDSSEESVEISYNAMKESDLSVSSSKYYSKRTEILGLISGKTLTRFEANEEGIKGAVSTITSTKKELAELKLSSSQFQTKVEEKQTEVDGTIKDHETRITQNATSIETKVSNDVFQSQIVQTSKEINLAVSSIAVGGVNIYGTNVPVRLSNGGSIIDKSKYGFKINTTTTSKMIDTPVNASIPPSVTTLIITPGFESPNWYNVSFDIKVSKELGYGFWLYYSYVEGGSRKNALLIHDETVTPNKETHISCSFRLEEGQTSVYLSSPFYDVAEFTFGALKIEKGNMETDWTPSVYDSEKDNEQKLLDTGIDIKNKAITVTADKFLVRSNSGVVGVSVFSDENGVPKLRAEYIDVKNLDVTKINAVDGTIGSFTINESGIEKEDAQNWSIIRPDTIQYSGKDVGASDYGLAYMRQAGFHVQFNAKYEMSNGGHIAGLTLDTNTMKNYQGQFAHPTCIFHNGADKKYVFLSEYANGGPGRFLFVRRLGTGNIILSQGKIMWADGSVAQNEGVIKDNLPRFFIYDGTYWHEYKCF